VNGEVKKTPLYALHLAAGAKMVDFAGWMMPIQYRGILEEHRAVREQAGLFDVSHMGEIRISGPGSMELVQRLITNDACSLPHGRVLYSPMCQPDGGLVDDLLVYRMGELDFLLVVNAANKDKDLAWIRSHGGAVLIEDQSDTTAQLAIQGPLAATILQRLTPVDLTPIRYYSYVHGRVSGEDCLISRTGYTGEDGFEIYLSPEAAPRLWERLLTAGTAEGLQPVGLGARDTLRFEAALPLYGQELSEGTTPLEAGLDKFIAWHKEDFIGRAALLAQREAGLTRKLVGLAMVDRGIPRPGYPVRCENREIGFITSGTFAPTLGQNLAMAYVEKAYAGVDQGVEVVIRDKGHKARVVPRPFYKRGQ